MHIIHTNISKGFRGGESQTFLLMKALRDLGIEQTLVCRTHSECSQRATEYDIPILPINHPVAGHWSTLGGDLVHVHDGRSVYWAWLEHLFSRTPYIITRRIPNPISDRRLTHKAYRNAAALIGVSTDCAQQLQQQINRPVLSILDAMTEHSIDEKRITYQRNQIGGDMVIGHIGALVNHHKAQSVLIEAFHILKEELPGARLVLVGEGADRRMLENLAQHDPRIIFTGFQKNIGDWIRCFDVFAFPSFEEGLGSSVLDVMAMRVPVITSKVGGLPELISENKRGILLPSHHPHVWAKTLLHVLKHPEAHEKQVEEAYKFALSRHAKNMAEQYLNVYRSALA